MHFVENRLAVVLHSVRPSVHALAVLLAFLELPLVLGAVLPHLEAVAVLQVVFPVALVV